MVPTKKQLEPQWCSVVIRKIGFVHRMDTWFSSTVLLEFSKGNTLAPYLFIICRDYSLKTSIDLIKENGFALMRKGTDDTPQKLLQMQTTLRTKPFLKMHLSRQNPCCIACSWQQEALSSVWMQIKRIVLNKQETSPL